MRRSVVLSGFTLALVALLAACSGGSSKPKASATTDVAGGGTTVAGGSTTETTASSVQQGSSLPDACTLLTPDEVKAALGTKAPATEAPIRGGNGGPEYQGCSWGRIASEDAVVAVQLSRPSGAGNIDYMKTLIGTVGETGTAVDVGENGKLLDRAYIPGGGGVGKSIMFTKNGDTVVVGMIRGDDAKLTAAANAVASNLG